MRDSLTYAGVSSESLGLHIEYCPDFDRPTRKMERYNVPGRNGDIVVMQDAWENVLQAYRIWGGNGVINDATTFGYSIANWLFSTSGYQRLTDTYDPNHYRLAYFEGPIDVENILRRRGRAEIIFTCDPRRFLTSGETATTFNATGTIDNPTPFTAKPVITVHGSGNGTIAAGGNTISIAGIYDGMVIDCENMNAYSGGYNLNNLISGDFPVIPSGTQTITITGGITSISVVPNWWTL